jgi:toxin ParE1/3/4
MSNPERELVLSPRAEADLTDILQYTLETWGEAQLAAYAGVLDDALRLLRDNPEIGTARPAVSERHRFLPAGEHVIAYRLTATRIEVSRILHGRMDLKRNF